VANEAGLLKASSVGGEREEKWQQNGCSHKRSGRGVSSRTCCPQPSSARGCDRVGDEDGSGEAVFTLDKQGEGATSETNLAKKREEREVELSFSKNWNTSRPPASAEFGHPLSSVVVVVVVVVFDVHDTSRSSSSSATAKVFQSNVSERTSGQNLSTEEATVDDFLSPS